MGDVILPSLISAGAGLVGVAVGGYFTWLNQRRDRQQRRIGEQLAEFYSPMLALHAKIRATRDVQLKVSSAAGAVWQRMASYNSEEGIEKVEKLTRERSAEFERITEYGNSQHMDIIMPAYRNMVELFISKMHLAEPSTIQLFPTLLEYVEIWDRHLANTLPREVLMELSHSEKTVFRCMMT